MVCYHKQKYVRMTLSESRDSLNPAQPRVVHDVALNATSSCYTGGALRIAQPVALNATRRLSSWSTGSWWCALPP